MKNLFTVIIGICLTWAGLKYFTFPVLSYPNKVTELSNSQTQDVWIDVFLPTHAEVSLKNGTQKEGQLISINSKAKQITLKIGRLTNITKIADIQKVELERDVIFLNRTPIVIRGDEAAKGKPETWKESLGNFKMINSSKGQAKIKLTSLPKDKIEAIQELAQELSIDYVVREIEFESSGKIVVKVIPY